MSDVNLVMVVSGCKNCIFCQLDTIEGAWCRYPVIEDMEFIFKAITTFPDTPKDCPLTDKTELTIFKKVPVYDCDDCRYYPCLPVDKFKKLVKDRCGDHSERSTP